MLRACYTSFFMYRHKHTDTHTPIHMLKNKKTKMGLFYTHCYGSIFTSCVVRSSHVAHLSSRAAFWSTEGGVHAILPPLVIGLCTVLGISGCGKGFHTASLCAQHGPGYFWLSGWLSAWPVGLRAQCHMGLEVTGHGEWGMSTEPACSLGAETGAGCQGAGAVHPPPGSVPPASANQGTALLSAARCHHFPLPWHTTAGSWVVRFISS